jgi:hypothetical protein
VHVYLSTAGSMASARAVSHMSDMDAADLRGLKNGDPDVHSDDDFMDEYNAAMGLIKNIHSLVVVVTGPFINFLLHNHSVIYKILIFFFRRSKRQRNFSLFYFASQES